LVNWSKKASSRGRYTVYKENVEQT